MYVCVKCSFSGIGNLLKVYKLFIQNDKKFKNIKYMNSNLCMWWNLHT